jgi:hypothetical protein
MNSFLEHHAKSIRFAYSCFDRILFNALIQPLQQPAIVVGFLDQYRNAPPLAPKYFKRISEDYHRWLQKFAAQRKVKIIEPPKGIRREQWVNPFYQRLRSPGIAVILKSRENARVAVSYPSKTGGHRIELYTRFVWQYYYYIQDRDFGRMFLRICPYFPFNARVCVNGHEWLAQRMRRLGITFRQEGNAFLSCSDPELLQQLSDQFSPRHVVACAHRWIGQLVPPFTERERRRGGCGHRLFASQVEYSTNLVFKRRAALDRMSERLFDLNRTIGRPDKLTTIFGRRVTKRYRGELKTQIADHHLASPVIRSNFKSSSIKQYVRDHLMLRTETTSYNTRDLRIAKSIENLPKLRKVMTAINDRYLDVQQDVLETYLDRGQLARLREPTVTDSGRRIPGIKLDDPRLLALMQALTRFAFISRGERFRTKDLHEDTATALAKTVDTYTLAQLRYDLGKLRAKGLVRKVPRTQSYSLTPEGFRLCIAFLKLFHKIYAPLTSAALSPVPENGLVPEHRRSTLDHLYAAVDHAVELLMQQIGIKVVA